MPNNINKDTKNIRIAKFISKAGAYSRRDAEKLIFEGKVEINGRTISTYQNKIAFAHWCLDEKGDYYLGYEYE